MTNINRTKESIQNILIFFTDEKADLIFTLKPGAMPMAITATFVGTK